MPIQNKPNLCYRTLGIAFAAATLLIPGALGHAASLTEQQAKAFAADAYVYF